MTNAKITCGLSSKSYELVLKTNQHLCEIFLQYDFLKYMYYIQFMYYLSMEFSVSSIHVSKGPLVCRLAGALPPEMKSPMFLAARPRQLVNGRAVRNRKIFYLSNRQSFIWVSKTAASQIFKTLFYDRQEIKVAHNSFVFLLL